MSPSIPRSPPVNTTSTAPSRTPASSSTVASGTPVHSPVPTASSTHGWLSGRGLIRLRPLPAHSMVSARVTAGRDRRSSSDKATGRSTMPSTESIHVAGSTTGMSKWVNR
jgi:hypothetical protein